METLLDVDSIVQMKEEDSDSDDSKRQAFWKAKRCRRTEKLKDGVHEGRVNTMLYTRSRLLYNAFGVFCASGLDSDETGRDGHVQEESSRTSN